jgi:FO synthase subunit 1
MERLKAVNVSMGLMLEQVTPDLLKTVHRYAPSKIPDVRLQQLEWAGRLRIPFTTGLLLGLGETAGDRRETLAAIARSHQRWGHIQEVILQPYSPGQREIRGDDPFPHHQLVSLIAEARHLLPADIAIQVPPNLVQDPTWLLACLDAGARDLGGLGPKDEVNPDYPHPLSGRLRQTLEAAGWVLQPRLPIYPDYDAWLPESLQGAVMQGRSRLRQPLQPPQFC